jgi:hypothetical protein
MPIFEVKRVLLSQRVDDSHISGGNFCWPFTIVPPTDSVSSSGSSAGSSLGHQSSESHNTGSDLKFQLNVTISRRGRLSPNVGFVFPILCHDGSLTVCFEFRVKQKIFYVPPPDPSLRSSPAQISVSLPLDTATTSSWPQQKFPPVVMRGVMFGHVNVEVECKVSN